MRRFAPPAVSLRAAVAASPDRATIDRRAIIGAAALFAFGRVAMPQTDAKRNRLVRIGRLSEGGSSQGATGGAAFRRALHQHGYVNVEIEARFAEGDPDRLPALAKQLARVKLDAIWANGSVAAQALKQATLKIPIVMVAADALRGGLVTDLARPEGNLTGLTLVGTELVAKRIQMLKGPRRRPCS